MNNFDTDTFSIECGTCIATGTTACTDCVVAHLLANDDGPIDLVAVTVGPPLSERRTGDRTLRAGRHCSTIPCSSSSSPPSNTAWCRQPSPYPDRVRRPEPLPTIDEIRGCSRRAGITHVGVTTADVLDRSPPRPARPQGAGLHGDMGFTYRDPDRSTDPGRAVEGARSVIVAARPYLTDADPELPRAEAGPHARVGRYAWVDHYAPLAAGVARRLPAASAGRTIVRWRSPTTTRSSTAQSPIAPGSGGTARTPTCCCPASGAGTCSAASSPPPRTNRRREPVADGCGTCRRCIDDCPTGAIVAPGVIDANRCLGWVLQKPGRDPARVPRGDRRPHLRLRRLPGRVPDLGAARTA